MLISYKTVRRLTMSFLLCTISLCAKEPASSFPLFDHLNYVDHPVTTTNPKAQSYFNQGLIFYYAFNHDAAYLCFEEASILDPQMAMAFWGMAIASGPTLGLDLSIEDEKKGFAAVQKAVQLSSHSSDVEKAYIQALAKRYTDLEKPDFKALEINYQKAMQDIVERYPDDLDAANLYAESGLNLNPDAMWKDNGQPNMGTLEVVQALNSVLKRNPQNVGANHLYIHTMEFSKFPERALPSADQLATVAPILTHLVHSASHIYMPVGDYEKSIQVNIRAVEGDEIYLKGLGFSKNAFGNYMHNLLYLIRSYTMAGHFKNAAAAAKNLQKIYAEHFDEDKEKETLYSTLLFVLLRFQKWNDVLKEKAPPSTMELSNALFHFARSAAYASLNRQAEALQEQQLFEKYESKNEKEKIPQLLEMLITYLDAKIAEMKGELPSAIEAYQKAVKLEDAFSTNPYDYLLIIRENLGEAMLCANQNKEAEEVFRTDLKKHPRNGRSLFGLYNSLVAQSRKYDAFWVKEEWKRAWQHADVKLEANCKDAAGSRKSEDKNP